MLVRAFAPGRAFATPNVLLPSLTTGITYTRLARSKIMHDVEECTPMSLHMCYFTAVPSYPVHLGS